MKNNDKNPQTGTGWVILQGKEEEEEKIKKNIFPSSIIPYEETNRAEINRVVKINRAEISLGKATIAFCIIASV